MQVKGEAEGLKGSGFGIRCVYGTAGGGDDRESENAPWAVVQGALF